MKAHILLFPVLAAFAGAASAAELTGGLKTGLNIATFVGADADAAGDSKISRAGLVAGGFLILPVQAPFKVQVEALISEKGAIYKWDLLGEAFETRYKLTYLEIPVLARFDFQPHAGARPSLMLGPSFGIKLSARGEARTVGAASTGNIENIRGFDPGLAVGGLIEMETSKGFVSIEARYTRSLVTIHDGSGGSDSDIKNSVASLVLAYRF